MGIVKLIIIINLIAFLSSCKPRESSTKLKGYFETNRDPLLDLISDQDVTEGVAFSQIDASDDGDDFDIDHTPLTYSCAYDNTVDGSINPGSSCSSLSGLIFTSSTGVMDWTPDNLSAGIYEFAITGSDGKFNDSEFFTLTVLNLNLAPDLDDISDLTATEGMTLQSIINAGDDGDDLDIDNETITYECVYDTLINADVSPGASCISLTGVYFLSASGIFSWTPNYSQAGNYEFKITGSDGNLEDSDLFSIIVSDIPFIETKLVASDTTSAAYFGGGQGGVTLTNDTIVVGASGDNNTNGRNAGSAYIYRFDPNTTNWIETKITSSDGAVNDSFGISVAISNNNILIGAWLNDEGAVNGGAAYLFQLDPTTNIWEETFKFLHSGANANDQFGGAVSISGNSLIVSSRLSDISASDAGAAYIFRYDQGTNSWAETELLASDGSISDNFGSSVSISGNTAVVGALYDNDNGANSGSSYFFRLDPSINSWAETKIVPSDGTGASCFGNSVAISDNTAVISAFRDDDNGEKSGSIYIYQLDATEGSWYETKITASDGVANDEFGYSVAVMNSNIVVGAPNVNSSGASSGAVYVYSFDPTPTATWIETKYTATDGATEDYFGRSVAISTDKFIVSSYLDDDIAINSGSAYLFQLPFESNAWYEEKIIASNSASGDEFGFSVAISNNIAVVGSYLDDNGVGNQAGAVYVYRLDPDAHTWEETIIATASLGDDDQFGYSVNISGSTIIAGSPYDDDRDLNAGAAYIYHLDPSTDSWFEVKLTASDGTPECYFGTSVSVSDSNAIVGTGNDSAYIYRLDPNNIDVWYQTKITASDGSGNDQFGYSVDISGNTAIVGAPNVDKAYIFRLNPTSPGTDWIETIILPSDGESSDQFGYSVSISNNTLAVGSLNADGEEENSGAVYIYRLDPNNQGTEWVESKIIARNGYQDDKFGTSVDISGNLVIIGSNQDDDNGENSGSAHIYQFDIYNNIWSESKKLISSDGSSNDSFGKSVAISGTSVIVGASGVNSSAGASYIYRLDPNP